MPHNKFPLSDDIDWEDLLEEEEEEEEEDEEDDEEDDDSSKTFTQEEVNRIMSREKKSGRRSGVKSVLQELGVSSLDELKEKLGSTNDDDDDDDVDKGKNSKEAERARKRQEKANQAETEAKRERTAAKVERRLLRGDANPKRLDHLIRLVELDDLFDADDEDIDDVVAELREDVPEFFNAADGGEGDQEEERTPGRAKPKTTPGGPPRSKSKTSPEDRAKARLQARHGSKLSKD